MKIAVYYDLPYGGAFRSIEEIVIRLKKNHQITEFHSDPISLKKGFLGRLLGDFYTLVYQRISQKELARNIDSQNFDLVFITHDSFLQSPWLLRFLKTKTVFLCQEPTRAFFEKFLDIDESLPLGNKIYEKLNRFFRKSCEIKNASFATKIIANSNYSTESIFRSYGQRSIPVYLGIDPNQFYHQKVKKLNQVIVVGNNEPQKGLKFAVDSISLVNKNLRPDLVIACPRTPLDSQFLKYAKSKKVKVIEKCGLSPQDLCSLYNQSLLTLATAHLEPFGLSVVESMACGTPVVAVNEGGFRETVIHRETGLLSSRDEAEFAQSVTELLQDKKLYQEISRQDLLITNKKFNWDLTVQKIEKIFYEIA